MKTVISAIHLVGDRPVGKIVATVTLVGGSPYVQGPRHMSADILQREIDVGGGRIVTASDGVEFLKALEFAFSGSRMRAVYIP